MVRDAKLPPCDSPKRGVKGIREKSQLIKRFDGFEGGVRRCGKV